MKPTAKYSKWDRDWLRFQWVNWTSIFPPKSKKSPCSGDKTFDCQISQLLSIQHSAINHWSSRPRKTCSRSTIYARSKWHGRTLAEKPRNLGFFSNSSSVWQTSCRAFCIQTYSYSEFIRITRFVWWLHSNGFCLDSTLLPSPGGRDTNDEYLSPNQLRLTIVRQALIHGIYNVWRITTRVSWQEISGYEQLQRLFKSPNNWHLHDTVVYDEFSQDTLCGK